MQNITASTLNAGDFGAQQRIAATGVEPTKDCPRPCYSCFGNTAQREDYRCGSMQTPSHGYCSGSQGDTVQCSCNEGFSGQYCTPAGRESTQLIWWRYLLGIAGSAFTILLSVYSARQHLVTRLRKRHVHHGPLSMNAYEGSDDDNSMPAERGFDCRDRFTMSILRGKIREEGMEAAALADVLRPLLRGSADANEPNSALVVQDKQSGGEGGGGGDAGRTEEGGRGEEQGGRGWSVINDAALSAAQRADEVRSWTPHMVGTRVRSIGAAFAPYAAVMVENGVDGQMFAALDEADLVGELGVKKVHAKKLLQLARDVAADMAPDLTPEGRKESGELGVGM
jgi:hypothetical protein